MAGKTERARITSGFKDGVSVLSRFPKRKAMLIATIASNTAKTSKPVMDSIHLGSNSLRRRFNVVQRFLLRRAEIAKSAPVAVEAGLGIEFAGRDALRHFFDQTRGLIQLSRGSRSDYASVGFKIVKYQLFGLEFALLVRCQRVKRELQAGIGVFL